MQSGNQNSALLAVLDLTATPSVLVPFASGTILNFTAPKNPVNVTGITVTVQPPGPDPTIAAGLGEHHRHRLATSVSTVGDIDRGDPGRAVERRRHARLSEPGGEHAGAQLPLAVRLVERHPGPAHPGLGPRSGLCRLSGQRGGQPDLAVHGPVHQLSGAAAAPPATTPAPNIPTASRRPGSISPATRPTAPASVPLDAMQIVNLILVPDMASMTTSNYLTSATATLNYAIQRKAFAISRHAAHGDEHHERGRLGDEHAGHVRHRHHQRRDLLAADPDPHALLHPVAHAGRQRHAGRRLCAHRRQSRRVEGTGGHHRARWPACSSSPM